MVNTAADSTELYRLGEAAKYVGIRRDSLRALANEGLIPCARRQSDCSPKGERVFCRKDLDAYRARVAARLETQLARFVQATDAEKGEAA